MLTKKMITATMSIAFVLTNMQPIMAQENLKNSDESVPAYMQPNSEILYYDDYQYTIIKGGEVTEKPLNNQSDSSKKLLKEAVQNGTYDSAMKEGLPSPVKGLKVTYASDGRIQDMIYPEGVENPLLKEEINVNSIQTRAGGPGPQETLIASWGNGNYLYKDNKGNKHGIGRATTFSDTIGQNDIRLKKGDVATKLKYDNCAVNTPVSVWAYTKSNQYKGVLMYKRDAGGMPDAVLDIWKTGVENWGYKWTSTFSMPRDVDYFHS